jgi:hypothetical protein
MNAKRTLLLAIFIFGVTRPCWPQVLTNTTDGTLNSFAAFGTLTPGSSNTPSTQQLQFRLRCKSNIGYHVSATLLSFTVVPIDPAQGGVTVSSSDVGIGITFVDTSASGVNTPRVDTISNGFNYDPGSVTAVNGMQPYKGIALGQATLADLTGTKILSGPRIASNENVGSSTNFITVTMKLGLLREYFTPASFNAVIGLTVSNGP